MSTSAQGPALSPRRLLQVYIATGLIPHWPSRITPLSMSTMLYFTLCPLHSHTPPFPHRSHLNVRPDLCIAIESVECSSYFPATVLTPLEQYHRLVDSGTLRADDHQTRIIGKLQRLHDDLLHYQPPPVPGAAPSLSLVCLGHPSAAAIP